MKSPELWDPGHLSRRMHVLRLQKIDVRRIERVSKRKILIYFFKNYIYFRVCLCFLSAICGCYLGVHELD